MRHTLQIDRLGMQGEGIAAVDGASVFVPFALPGERVDVALDNGIASDMRILEPVADRVKPACRHFGRCGGCQLQHVSPAYGLAWKTARIREALSRVGLGAVPVTPGWQAPLHSRRRATFAARRTRGGVLLGYRIMRSHDIVDCEMCPVLDKRIVAALPTLRELTRGFLSRTTTARVSVTLAVEGLDVAIEDPRDDWRKTFEAPALGGVASRGGVCRLVVEGEVIYQTSVPHVVMGRAQVPLAPGVFLQAVAEAEDQLSAIACDALRGTTSVADLFSGAGTFSFRLAEFTRVTAVEYAPAALRAIEAGVRGAEGLKPISILARNLFEEPLAAREFDGFDGVVFDPPRAGARAQTAQLALSRVPTVVAVSCNPATFARDAAALVAGGYVLRQVVAIDQFLYSSHIELIAVFRR